MNWSLCTLAAIAPAITMIAGCETIQNGGIFLEQPLSVWQSAGGEEEFRTPAWSPDGNRLATANWNNRTVQLSKFPEGTDQLLLHGHRDFIGAIDWGPDGAQLATAAKTIKLWKMPTGTELRSLEGNNRKTIWSLAWSPDGKRLASGGGDGTVRVWDSRTGEQIQAFHGHDGPINVVAWIPDGKRIASSGNDSTARLWNLATAAAEHVLRDHSGSVNGLAWSPDGELLATADSGKRPEPGRLRFWDPATGKQRTSRQTDLRVELPFGFLGTLFSLTWSPDGRYVAVGANDGTVRIVNVTTGKQAQVLKGVPFVEVMDVSWNPNGRYLVASDFSGNLFAWETRNRRIGN